MQSTFSPSDITAWQGSPVRRASVRCDGFRGIWYTLGFSFEYGDKYSGGLGTYTANHQPMAVYSERSDRTFFTYGGTTAPEKRELVVAVAVFDHRTGEVEQPVVLYIDPSVDDPHDNAAIQIDDAGYVWVFKSGRGNRRPGLIFRSVDPFSIDAFDLVDVQTFAYPQVWRREGGGFFLLFTKYVLAKNARGLFWKTTPDGRTWSEDHALAAFEGHYQTSATRGNKTVTFFNWHPDSDVDRRTNLYFAQTLDDGRTWTTADGTPLEMPLTSPQNDALVIDYQSRGRCMYTCDAGFDQSGNPVLLYITSGKGEPGPRGGHREWTILHWMGDRWEERVVTTSSHNYDMGSLFIDGAEWRIIGPTGEGPQPYGTGGEIALWVSSDEGRTWTQQRLLTSRSEHNHSYVRRPENAKEPFSCFWADGHADRISRSHLYFSDLDGKAVHVLPYEMKDATATPALRRPE